MINHPICPNGCNAGFNCARNEFGEDCIIDCCECGAPPVMRDVAAACRCVNAVDSSRCDLHRPKRRPITLTPEPEAFDASPLCPFCCTPLSSKPFKPGVNALYCAACQQLPAPEPEGPKPHNPDGLTPEQVGVADGWRLLNEDEIRQEKQGGVNSAPFSFWSIRYGGEWVNEVYHADSRITTYRTRLSPEELRKARGLELLPDNEPTKGGEPCAENVVAHHTQKEPIPSAPSTDALLAASNAAPPESHPPAERPIWTYSNYRASLRKYGEFFAIVTKNGLDSLPQPLAEEILTLLNSETELQRLRKENARLGKICDDADDWRGIADTAQAHIAELEKERDSYRESYERLSEIEAKLLDDRDAAQKERDTLSATVAGMREALSPSRKYELSQRLVWYGSTSDYIGDILTLIEQELSAAPTGDWVRKEELDKALRNCTEQKTNRGHAQLRALKLEDQLVDLRAKFSAAEAQLTSMTRERDRIRDDKWNYVQTLETKLAAHENALGVAREAIKFAVNNYALLGRISTSDSMASMLAQIDALTGGKGE